MKRCRGLEGIIATVEDLQEASGLKYLKDIKS